MFCSDCGTQLQSGLTYCSRCGRRVAEDAKRARGNESSPIVVAANTGFAGFVAFIFVIIAMSMTGFPTGLILPISLFYFASLFGICFLILRRGSRAHSDADQNGRWAEAGDAPSYLRPPITAQLSEASDLGIGSVTDATTRTLDTAFVEKKS